jgi:DNA-binding NarL/FixJ family response regulator
MKTMMSETRIKVVLADDHAVVRAGIREFLETTEDIEVVAEVGDGEEAITAIRSTSPDVAILDIQMPQKGGIEVTRWLRTEQVKTGVLILTAYDDDPYVIAVLKAGANGYVLKTASANEIIRAVRAVHEGQSVLDPTIAHKVITHLSKDQQDTPVDALTDRELQVLALAGKGFTNKAIGVQLGISSRTVQGHLAKIYDKLHAESRTEAVMRAVSMGWLSPDIGQLK